MFKSKLGSLTAQSLMAKKGDGGGKKKTNSNLLCLRHNECVDTVCVYCYVNIKSQIRE